MLGSKVVEVVLQLPDLCLSHLDQRVLAKQSDQNILEMLHFRNDFLCHSFDEIEYERFFGYSRGEGGRSLNIIF